MIRVEIISNQSVQEDVLELIESEIPDIEYTLTPGVQGKGLKTKKAGDAIWPELNFRLVSYTSKENAKKINTIMKLIKSQFPDEGISWFFVQVMDSLE